MPWRRGWPTTNPSVTGYKRDEPSVRYLRHQSQLIRRTAIRRVLSGRFHRNGINNINEIIRLLAEQGIHTHRMTISTDLQAMGAVKVQDSERPSIMWWVVPSYNPNVENLRESLDPESVEQEVQQKVLMHVVDITPLGSYIYIMTEPRAGAMLGYWISWLSWQGIVFVQDQLDGCIIHCVDEEHALRVYAQLVGKEDGDVAPEEEAEAADRPD